MDDEVSRRRARRRINGRPRKDAAVRAKPESSSYPSLMRRESQKMNARKSDIPSGMTVYLGGSPTPPLRPDASILLVALLIIGSISLPACIMPQSSYRDVVAFKVNLSPDGPAVLLVPIPVNEEFVQRIRITQGTGNLSYVDTLHGRCLRIATSTYRLKVEEPK